MSSFAARLQLPGQTKLPLNVAVDITDERLHLAAGDQPVGDWPIAELEFVREAERFHITVDAEEMILTLTEPDQFASELGVSGQAGSSNSNVRDMPRYTAVNSTVLSQLRYEDVKIRIQEVEAALTSDAVPPDQVFVKWLKLLKEINRRNGQGTMPPEHFYELNTRLLDLIPEPKPANAISTGKLVDKIHQLREAQGI